MASKFRKGQIVEIEVSIGGFESYEEGTVLKVDNKGVWLDNGDGNDPSGPYDKETGILELFVGFQTIRPKKKK